MIKLLMIYSIAKVRNFLYIIINREEDFFLELIKLVHEYPNAVFFPVMNQEDINNISNLIDNNWKVALLHEINDSKKVLGLYIKNKCVKIHSLEHLNDDVFNIISDEEVFTSNNFKPCITYVEGS